MATRFEMRWFERQDVQEDKISGQDQNARTQSWLLFKTYWLFGQGQGQHRKSREECIK